MRTAGSSNISRRAAAAISWRQKLLGPGAGVVSGCALLVDYVLTISVSIASAADQIFSFLPLGWHGAKVPLEMLAIVVLLVLNMRGVKESVAVLIENLHLGTWFVVLCLIAEGALLVVAAQTGFIDGPRVMANMALDSWLPRRFTSLSERLTMHYGLGLMAAASIATLLYTKGDMTALVTMYSINVFITFSLTEMGMVRFWITERRKYPEWKQALPIHATGLTLCLSILVIVICEKFTEGGWLTVVITSLLIGLCWLIRHHYRKVFAKLDHLAKTLGDLPPGAESTAPVPLDPAKPTAILLVNRCGGLGLHSLLNLVRQFPGYFQQVVFVSVAVIDSGAFKGADEIEAQKTATQADLDKFVTFARSHGLIATGVMDVGTEPVETAEEICTKLTEQYSKATFFTGKLIFEREKWYQRILHNETAYAIQRRLQWRGLATVVLPIRVRE